LIFVRRLSNFLTRFLFICEQKFKQASYSKQTGTYEYQDNPYVNLYDNYKSLDVNFEQYLPPPAPVPPSKPKHQSMTNSSPRNELQPYESKINREMHNGGPGNTETPRTFYSHE
jgi:hypothetical protein